MKRIHADVLLGLAGLIWGFGFVAQKDAFSHIGAATFVAARCFLSALFVLPFALRESRCEKRSEFFLPSIIEHKLKIFMLCAVFAAAVIVQQIGIEFTTATNAAFITGLYVVLVPFASRLLYAEKIIAGVFAAGALSVAGIWLLSGADLGRINPGDALMVLCAVFFSFQVSMLGHLVGATKAPCTISFLQYLVTGVAALVLGGVLGDFHVVGFWHDLTAAWVPIAYAGILGGGVAYTLQGVAQQYTPSADSAIIMGCGESLFGALGGAWFFHETISRAGLWGCALILVSIVLVEILPYLKPKLS